MTKRKNIFLGVLIIILILGGLFLAYNYYFKGKNISQTQEKEEKVDNTLFYVAQAEGVWPKFVEVRIDPLKVSVGQVQKMKVVLENDVDIKEVKAIIETDNQKLEIPLKLQEKRAVTKEDIENKKYIVKDSKLVILDKNSKNFGDIVEQLVKSANAAQVIRFEYVGEWTVHDTHDKTYHTIFKAYDEKGRENSITIAWSDPCSPPLGRDYEVNYSVSCEVSPTGPDDGNVIIDNGATLTIGTTTPVTFVWGPGKSITVGGRLVIKDGSQLKQSRIYVGPDADNDGYMPTGTIATVRTTTYPGPSFILGANSVRASSSDLLPGDCNDTNPYAYPGSIYYGTAINGWAVGYYGGDYNCDGQLSNPTRIANGITYYLYSLEMATNSRDLVEVFESDMRGGCYPFAHGSCGQEFSATGSHIFGDENCQNTLQALYGSDVTHFYVPCY
jgi:hypothetical protein